MAEINRTAGNTGHQQNGAVMTRTSTNTHQQSSYGLSILIGLDAASGGPKHVYGGTVPVATTAKRRVKNRAARLSRRINRKRGNR